VGCTPANCGRVRVEKLYAALVKKFVQAQIGVGAALFVLGITVMTGWVIRNAALVQICPDFVGMVFSTAVCFSLVGATLLIPPVFPRAGGAVQTSIGWLLMGFGLLVLAEYVVDGNFGFDFPSFHAWLDDGNPRPGRMAFNTCIGFIFCGLALAFMQRVSRKAHGVAVTIGIFSASAVGLTGVVASSLDLGLLYSRFYSSRMPLHTAVGMLLAGAGLWLNWYWSEWYRSGRYFKEDEKVSFVGGIMLIVVALTAGIAGFSAQESTLEKTLGENLASILNSRITLINNVIRHSQAHGAAIAGRQDLMQVMQALRDDPDNRAALVKLQEIGANAVSADVNAIAVYDAQDREIMEFGRFSDTAEVAVGLHAEIASTLFWNGALHLNSRLPITDRNETIGYIAVEQALPVLTEQLARMHAVGDTGIIAMCIEKAEHFLCFPPYRNARVARIPHHNKLGQPLPMNDAVAGRSGIFTGLDHKGRNVIAAYGPVNSAGLGLVVKQDTEELYQHIRSQLELTIVLLILFVAISAWLLRLHVKPLATRLLLSEHAAKEKELRTRTVVDNVGEGIITLNTEGVIETFNDAASRIFGYSQAEAVGQNIRFLMPADMRDLHDTGMRRFIDGGEARVVGKRNIELPGLHKDGTVFQLELTVNEMHICDQRLFVGIVRDVTERRKAEEALRAAHAELEERVQERTAELVKANEQLIQEIAERKRVEDALRFTQLTLTKAQAIAHLGSWELDIRTGYVEWSDEFYRLGGLQPQSADPSIELGLGLFHPDDREVARRALGGAMAGGGTCKYEWRLLHPDGSMRHVLCQGEAIYNDNDEPVTLVGTFLDITEHKLAEEALRASQDKLREMAAHQDRIKEEERKRIAREIHDELGGLLTGVKSYLSFSIDAAERAGQPADRYLADAIALVDSAIETARRVITDLRPSVLDQLGLWAALEWYAGQIAERTSLRCHVEIDQHAVEVTVDPERSTALFRIVQETLTNAVRHAKASSLEIRARCEEGAVVIEIEDDGIGIEPEKLLTRESWGIAGMYERARYFGGDLSFAGTAGKGTIVVLRMPMENENERRND
jgi:PAS domain S-box-containing protein